jgi:hypothetical protein
VIDAKIRVFQHNRSIPAIWDTGTKRQIFTTRRAEGHSNIAFGKIGIRDINYLLALPGPIGPARRFSESEFSPFRPQLLDKAHFRQAISLEILGKALEILGNSLEKFGKLRKTLGKVWRKSWPRRRPKLGP